MAMPVAVGRSPPGLAEQSSITDGGINAHGQDLEILSLQSFVEPLHGGHFLLAGHAPGGPDVYQEDLPPVVFDGMGYSLPVDGDEGRRRAPCDHRISLTTAQPCQEHHRSGEPPRDHCGQLGILSRRSGRRQA
jgi:hypothetical protein